jgi:hypothetical protein
VSWCFQCGVAGKPEQAVGWDEDGEPACGLHRLKAQRPFNLEDVSRGSTHGQVPERVAEKSSPIIPAAPSPVQIKQERIMEEKFCIVEGCGKKLRSHNNSGYCKPHRNEVRKPKQAKQLKKPSKVKPEPEPPTQGAGLTEEHSRFRDAMGLVARGANREHELRYGYSPDEPTISLTIPVAKLQRLIALLL